MMAGLIVTIDGPAGAGKTSTARGVAERFGYRYLDTGALYRTLALAVLRSGAADPLGPDAVEVCRRAEVRPRWRGSAMDVLLDGEDVSGSIRAPEVTGLVSPLSANPEIRSLLIRIQRGAAGEGGLVVEGRDIGTVVFPEAPVKIYLFADIDERARRRAREMERAGLTVDPVELRRAIAERDRRDSGRAVAPLKRPADAIDVDTTGMTLEGQIERIVRIVREAGG
ncbi:MAG: (d)CMP kinase [Candidatus Eisenbacteria bacterium]